MMNYLLGMHAGLKTTVDHNRLMLLPCDHTTGTLLLFLFCVVCFMSSELLKGHNECHNTKRLVCRL